MPVRRAQPGVGRGTPALLLGPLLRHVSPTSATLWVETDGPATVEVTAGPLTATARTVMVAGHHYSPAVLTGLEPGTATPYGEVLPPSRIRPPGDAVPVAGRARCGREDQVARALAALEDARRGMYRILAEDDVPPQTPPGGAASARPAS